MTAPNATEKFTTDPLERRSAQAVFAATFIALGVLGLITRDLPALWQGAPENLPGRGVLAILCALVSLGCGLTLPWQRCASIGARVLLGYLLLGLVLVRARALILVPLAQDSWSGLGETAVVLCAAWTLYARRANDWDRRWLGWAIGARGQRGVRVVYGLAMIPFGIAHFTYLKETASLVPGWLPGHEAWAYFTACTYLVAGAAIVAGVQARLAAALSGVQMGLFTLMVWLPIVSTGSANAFEWSETIISWILTVSAWLIYESLGKQVADR